MIWADRLALFWALLVFLFFFALAGSNVLSVLGHPSIFFLFIGAPWLVLRALDLVCSGPQRRAQLRYTRSFPPPLPPGVPPLRIIEHAPTFSRDELMDALGWIFPFIALMALIIAAVVG
jgi:hypothetical protein